MSVYSVVNRPSYETFFPYIDFSLSKSLVSFSVTIYVMLQSTRPRSDGIKPRVEIADDRATEPRSVLREKWVKRIVILFRTTFYLRRLVSVSSCLVRTRHTMISPLFRRAQWESLSSSPTVGFCDFRSSPPSTEDPLSDLSSFCIIFL